MGPNTLIAARNIDASQINAATLTTGNELVATQNWVTGQGYATKTWVKDNYVSKNNSYVTYLQMTEYVNENIPSSPDLSDYATEKYVDDAIEALRKELTTTT